jgi:ABC-type sugar transport system substrate-binding protein
MMRVRRGASRRVSSLLAAAAASSVVLAACGGGNASSTAGGGSSSSGPKKLTIGMAVGGQPDVDWQKAQGDVARALAKKRGWDFVELSNNGEAPAATKNVDTFIQKKVDAVIEFNGQPSVNPVMAKKLAAAKIPAITFDIAQQGWYFVGIDNQAAGEAGGKSLGDIARKKWNCDVDLVLSAEGKAAGPVNEARTGGMRTGLKSVCPDIPASKYVSFESNGQVSVAQPAARDALASHPEAKKILVVGINDSGVVGALQAAEQLGRADNIIGWGQDGSLITGANVNPHLAGSVFYFLESYPTYTFDAILDKIAAGQAPPVKDTGEDPAVQIKPCPVTAAEAAKIPGTTERVAKLASAPAGKTALDLFCPQQAG